MISVKAGILLDLELLYICGSTSAYPLSQAADSQ